MHPFILFSAALTFSFIAFLYIATGNHVTNIFYCDGSCAYVLGVTICV